MPNVNRKAERCKGRDATERNTAEEWSYPTGMVWCQMKMSGMAILKCAELQKQFGCGSRTQFTMTAHTRPANIPYFWPWLERQRECPKRAHEKEVRELRLVLTPLRVVDKSTKNPRAYRCPACGEHKAFGARQCRRCWRRSLNR